MLYVAEPLEARLKLLPPKADPSFRAELQLFAKTLATALVEKNNLRDYEK